MVAHIHQFDPNSMRCIHCGIGEAEMRGFSPPPVVWNPEPIPGTWGAIRRDLRRWGIELPL